MKKRILSIILLSTILMSGCKKEAAVMNEYSLDNTDVVYNYQVSSNLTKADGFASNLAVPDEEKDSDYASSINSEAALMVDATTGTVLFQKNVHEKLYPASITKILTAYLALKNAKLDDVRKMGPEVIVTEYNAVLCDFREGDMIPMEICLYGALLKSGNDAAEALAQYVTKTQSEFYQMMNDEAKEMGATESHFCNANGLTNPEHYTTAYDLYLIFNQCIQNEEFVKIISTKTYKNTFNRGKYIINAKYDNTNRYLSGEKTPPAGVKIIGGKAGYTEAALRCYVMLSEGSNGHKYISVVLKCKNNDKLYDDLDYMLNLIPQ